MKILRWSLAFIIFIAAPIYLGMHPEEYTPMVQVLLSIFLFLAAYWIGYSKEIEKAEKSATQKWLPQAESVIYRLLTLHSNVKRLAITTNQNCTKSNCDLPELQTDELKAVRIKLKIECEANSQRLDDIARQLEDAIEDWRRFVAANCDGDECGRIFDAITDRKERLDEDMKNNKA